AKFLSTPSVGRATDLHTCACFPRDISIHALRGEGDRDQDVDLYGAARFLSTPSVGRATQCSKADVLRLPNFYPRPPWGGRPLDKTILDSLSRFLSTPSVGRATARTSPSGS